MANFSALDVSKEILRIGRKYQISDLSPLKLQKLLYFTFIHHAQNKNEQLFSENFAVWRHGPVVKSVYNYFSKYGSTVITEEFVDIPKFDRNITNSIVKTLEEYGNKSAWNLVDDTHSEGGLWFKKMKSGMGEITFKDIIDDQKA